MRDVKLCEHCNAVVSADKTFDHLMEHVERQAASARPESAGFDAEAFDFVSGLVDEHPLFEAIINGNTARAGSMIAADTRLAHLRSRSHSLTPLHVAAGQGETGIAQLLIRAGARLDAATTDGLTPLHCAAGAGEIDAVILLLDSGADFQAVTRGSDGKTAKHLAIGALMQLDPSGQDHSSTTAVAYRLLVRLLNMAELMRRKGQRLNPGHSYREIFERLQAQRV